MEQFIVLSWPSEWEREMQSRTYAEQGDASNSIKNRCFRTLILKRVK